MLELLWTASGAGDDLRNHANCIKSTNMAVHFAHLTKPGPSSETFRPVCISQPWITRDRRGCCWQQGTCALCDDGPVELILRICPREGAMAQTWLRGKAET